MKLLLDTHLILWAAGKPERLSKEAYALIYNPSNTLFFSVASIWEIAIKQGLGRDDFKVDTRLLHQGLLANGYNELPINSKHAIFIDSLPLIHKDPFDRMLIAQSTVESITLLTADVLVAQYLGPILKIE